MGNDVAAGRRTGVVVRFVPERGYGFLKPDDGGVDLFAHIADVKRGRPLIAGESVEFTSVITPRGPRAVGIVPIEA